MNVAFGDVFGRVSDCLSVVGACVRLYAHIMNPFAAIHIPAPIPSWQDALIAVLLAYVLCQILAQIYLWTTDLTPKTQTLPQTLILSGIVSSLLMLAIGNSLSRGIGLVGALTMIRFRTNLRDPRDMVFVFASFGAGIAAGTGNLPSAAMGVLVFSLVSVAMRLAPLGNKRIDSSSIDELYEVKLRLPVRVEKAAEGDSMVRSIFAIHCQNVECIEIKASNKDPKENKENKESKEKENKETKDIKESVIEYTYNVVLRSSADGTPRAPQMLAALLSLPGVSSVAIEQRDEEDDD